jgi:hypothetical protein
MTNPNRQQIIELLYIDPDINKGIAKMKPEDLQDDLRQEMFLVLCEMPEQKLIQMHSDGYLKFFLVRTMLNMMKSDRSTFYNQFRKIYTEFDSTIEKGNEENSDEFEEISNKLKKSLDVLHWYEKEIFRLYSENGKNILKLSRETKIPYRSLFKTVRKVKTYLKYKIRNHAID